MVDFQKTLSAVEDAGAKVVAISADGESDARETIAKHGLTYEVAHSVDPVAFSTATGAYYEGDGEYLHASAFIVDPSGKVALAVYSTGPVGRLKAKEAAGLIDYIKGNS